MSIIDTVAELNQSDIIKKALGDQKLCVGIGCSVGDIYATRLGMKNQKDNVAMGQTVKEADIAEDEVAGVGLGANLTEVAVTPDCYKCLSKSENNFARVIKSKFKERGSYYICSKGLKRIIDEEERKRESHNYEEAKKTTSVKPWKRDRCF